MVMRARGSIETSKGQVDIEGPIGYSGMRVEELQKLSAEWKNTDDFLEAFSILYGVDYKLLVTSKDPMLQVLVMKAMTFLGGINLKKLPVPEFIDINGHKLQIPTKLGALSIGQAITLRQAMDEKPREQLIAYASAVYLQPLYFNNELPDSEQINLLEQVLLKCSVIDLFPVGYFFLNRLSNFGNPLLNLFKIVKVLGIMKTVSLMRLQGLKALMILPI